MSQPTREPSPSAFEREELYTSPERIFRGLVLSPGKGQIPKEFTDANPNLVDKYRYWGHVDTELCYICGWTSQDEVHSAYQPHMRVGRVSSNMAMWEIGHRWLIRDRPNDATVGNDFITQEFLRSQKGLNIPLVKELRKLSSPEDKVHIELMARAEGERLCDIWEDLTLEQKHDYAKQIRDVLKLLRQFTSPVAQKVDGSPACKQVGRTNKEWFEDIKEELYYGLSSQYETEDLVIIDARYQEFKSNFPKSEPYVLTHADLNLGNILVKNNKIEAIIDWEYSGYFPWWYERYVGTTGVGSTELSHLVWSQYGSELDGMTKDVFSKEITSKITPVLYAFKLCLGNTKHTNLDKVWYRQPFCKCYPYCGNFQGPDFGVSPTHEVIKKLKGKCD